MGDEIVLGLEEIFGGLEQPTHITNAGDGSDRLFITERAGRVRVAAGGALLPEPLFDLRQRVKSDEGEQGMFATVFHPRFPSDNRIFVVYTRWPDGAYVLESLRVSDDGTADLATRRTLLVVAQPSAVHNGGGLAFGPDGYLYLGLGDGGPPEDPDGAAQNPGTLLGKILRLDVDTEIGYRIPSDNPFVGVAGYRPEIWALGLRNPWRIEFDPATGDMYIGDVGSGAWEEINVVPGGDPGGMNFGWSEMEGFACWPPNSYCDPEDFTLPVTTYSHDVGCSVSGGHVYRGNISPGATGLYLFGDWCSGNIWFLARDGFGEWQSKLATETSLMITSFGADEAGELYVADFLSGTIYQLIFYQVDPSIAVLGTSPAVYAGEASLSLAIEGTGFTQSSVVHWNGREVPTTYLSDHELVALLTYDDVTPPLGFDGVITVELSVADIDGYPTISPPYPVRVNMFAHPAFQRTWERQDALVASADAVRTWMWGPVPLTGPIIEPYADAPGGERIVQYFDKTRMEFTDPDADPNWTWAVTNGRLVVEMITGQMQVGDDRFVERQPSYANVAGDQGSPTSPVYASFAGLLDPVDDATGEAITQRVDRDGTVTDDPGFATAKVSYAYFDDVSGHNIAEPFWEFMTSEALVYVDGEQVMEHLFDDPFYATGRPITEAYWAEISLRGEPRSVLIQCFERRCLTYTPGNPAGWQVETGNVGQHYYQWRYLGFRRKAIAKASLLPASQGAIALLSQSPLP